MKVLKGTIDDRIIRLERPAGFPRGTRAVVKLRPIKMIAKKGPVKKQLELLALGLDTGRILVSSRDDIYER